MIDREFVDELRRSFAAALEDADPTKARASLLSAGWLDALDDDPSGAVAVLFRQQGRTGRDAAALDDVITHAFEAGDAAVLYPVAPGIEMILSAHRHADRALRFSEDMESARLIELDQPLEATSVRGVDPAAMLALRSAPHGRGEDVGGIDACRRAIGDGRIAVSHELVGAAQALLDMATRYALDRRQFGTPISDFQAVKHRLADVAVAVAAADAATIAASSTGTMISSAVAKILAGRAAAVAGANCLQVFGGIGFTSEHPFPARFRRLLALDRFLGDSRRLERELGEQLRAGKLLGCTTVDLDDVPRLELA